MLTALEESYTNPASLSCTFEGTNEPTITWFEGSSEISSDTADDAYTEELTAWDDNTITSVLNIGDTLQTGVTSITCRITFDDEDDTLQTFTTIIKRGANRNLIELINKNITLVTQ